MDKIQRIALATIGLFLAWPLLAAAKGSARAGLSYLGRTDLPLGMRNNNPGNIRVSANAWQGKIKNGNGKGFEQFVTYAYGIRAMIRQLFTYHSRGWDTLDKILYKWAPPADNNDTEGYIRFVSARTGFGRHQRLDIKRRADMSALVRAMAQMENYGGREDNEAISVEQFNEAWGMAVSGIGAIYPTAPQVWECHDGTFSTSSGRRACSRHGGRRGSEPLRSGSGSSLLNIVDVPLHSIKIDRSLFQGREKAFSQRSVDNIVADVESGRFVWENLDPITLWRSPSGTLYLLSGHSRHRAFEILSEMGAMVDDKGFDKIPAKIRTGDLQAAQKLALESNTLSTKETDIERAGYYRRMRQDGASQQAIVADMKRNEGRNWTNILAYTYLSPSGNTWAAIKQFADGEDQSATLTKALAKWIGNARKSYPQLTNEHEGELYAWLFHNRGYGTGAGQVANERDFQEKVSMFVAKNTMYGEFQQDQPLNIMAAQYKSPAEAAWEQEYRQKAADIAELEKTVKAKIRSLQDHGATRAQMQDIVSPLERQLRNLRADLVALAGKKSQIIEYSKNEATLFGLSKKRRHAIV